MNAFRLPNWLVAAAALTTATCAAASSNTTAAEVDVLRADAARIDAMLASDLAALGELLTSDCLYVHSNGLVQTKREVLAALDAGAMDYAEIRYIAPPLVRRYGAGTVVLTGTTHTAVKLADGRELKLTLLVTAVYVKTDDRWQLASYQSTNAPSLSHEPPRPIRQPQS